MTVLNDLSLFRIVIILFEISFGGGVGGSMEFSYTEGLNTIPNENGSRLDSGLSANAFLYVGANFELPNSGALNSVSLLFETGYYYYMRYRTETENIDKKNKFKYHNLILGVLPKFNFNNGISFGIGAGIYLPLYSWISQKTTDASPLGLGIYGGLSKIDFK